MYSFLAAVRLECGFWPLPHYPDNAKPAVPGSQAVEESREQVKQKQGARFSRQFWRSLRSLEQAGTAVQ